MYKIAIFCLFEMGLMRNLIKEVEFKDLKGNVQKFDGVYEVKKLSRMDEPAQEYETLYGVLINRTIVELNGYGYFHHPDTGLAFIL